MKYCFLFLSVIILNICTISAQVGITGSYKNVNTENWDLLISNESTLNQSDFFGQAYGIGIDYWFRLKNYRIEFHPEVNLSKASHSSNTTSASAISTADATMIGLDMHTNFYILDFLGDCDCPTFTKSNDFFKKGFFVQLSPGITHSIYNAEAYSIIGDENSAIISTNYRGTGIKIAAGLGLDIGLSKAITITPMIRYGRLFNVEFDGLANHLGVPDFVGLEETSWSEITGSIRLGFRFDANNY